MSEIKVLSTVLKATSDNFGLVVCNYYSLHLWATSKCCGRPIFVEYPGSGRQVRACSGCKKDTGFTHSRTGVQLCHPSNHQYKPLLDLVAYVYGLDSEQRKTLEVTFA